MTHPKVGTLAATTTNETPIAARMWRRRHRIGSAAIAKTGIISAECESSECATSASAPAMTFSRPMNAANATSTAVST